MTKSNTGMKTEEHSFACFFSIYSLFSSTFFVLDQMHDSWNKTPAQGWDYIGKLEM